MRAYSTNLDTLPHPTLHKLSGTNTELIHQAAIWAEEQWDYVLKFVGLANRKRLVRDLTISPNAFYFLMYDHVPAGMFALRSCVYRTICAELKSKQNIAELDYVYIEKKFRGFGLGSHIIDFAKREAKAAGFKFMVLDTLDPSLNAFYIKHGAKFICKSQYHCLPTDKLMYDL